KPSEHGLRNTMQDEVAAEEAAAQIAIERKAQAAAKAAESKRARIAASEEKSKKSFWLLGGCAAGVTAVAVAFLFIRKP
ncbi:MAG: hypothetical protein K8T20_14900, partial [Planctomycetes bacterium]|nr:hypothetical protein [Planctomycetota bacterium]